jgi:maleate cis-trans isomerase
MKEWMIGIWDNYFGEGIERVSVIAPTKLEAKKKVREYINTRYIGSVNRYRIDMDSYLKVGRE